MFSDDNEYHKNKFARNGAGAAVMFSKRVKMIGNTFQDNWGPASYGLLLKELYDSELTGNTFYRNTIGINGENCTRMKYNEKYLQWERLGNPYPRRVLSERFLG